VGQIVAEAEQRVAVAVVDRSEDFRVYSDETVAAESLGLQQFAPLATARWKRQRVIDRAPGEGKKTRCRYQLASWRL
jgi:hypothetical protein